MVFFRSTTAGFACGRRSTDPENYLGTLGPNHPLESATASSAIRPYKQKAPAAGDPATGTIYRDGRMVLRRARALLARLGGE
jgi:hypothetical protein